MLEPLRSQYLAALGIDSYVPRSVLPGAKPSAACEWLETDAAAGDAAPVAGPSLSGDDAVDSGPVPVGAQSAAVELPAIETVSRPPPAATAATPKPPAQAESGPRFALSMVLAAGGLLLIDAAPVSGAERNAFQAMLNNMLPALRPEASQYVLDTFIWPLTRQPRVPQDADAAAETLAAYLHKQIRQRAIDTVLLLGEEAQRWCTLTDVDVRIVRSGSLLACVRDPALKRPLWNDIRHLADR